MAERDPLMEKLAKALESPDVDIFNQLSHEEIKEAILHSYDNVSSTALSNYSYTGSSSGTPPYPQPSPSPASSQRITHWNLLYDSETVSSPTVTERINEIEKHLHVCVVCGEEGEFVLCEICKESVRLARRALLREMAKIMEDGDAD